MTGNSTGELLNFEEYSDYVLLKTVHDRFCKRYFNGCYNRDNSCPFVKDEGHCLLEQSIKFVLRENEEIEKDIVSLESLESSEFLENVHYDMGLFYDCVYALMKLEEDIEKSKHPRRFFEQMGNSVENEN